MNFLTPCERRAFLKRSAAAAALAPWLPSWVRAASLENPEAELPSGPAPAPLEFAHFPDRLHAFVWRNWPLVSLERMARVVKAKAAELRAVGESMGLGAPPEISADQWRRSHLTIIRRNWHLLPYSQLLELLGWTAAHLNFVLREDDFLFIKLGSLKPKCAPLLYSPPRDASSRRAEQIARSLKVIREKASAQEPLFSFVRELSAPPPSPLPRPTARNDESIRFCYSYFALYGDPLLETEVDPYPEGLLATLAALGVNGVWMQAVLTKLAPFPWIEESAADRSTRLATLRKLTERAARHGIKIYLYLNEPRTLPLSFFEKHPNYKGVVYGDQASLCTSHPDVQAALTDAISSVASAAPELGGFFTITASENQTNCWSHGRGGECGRCGKRSAAEVIAEVNGLFQKGIQKAGTGARLIVWDWGWNDAWAEEAIRKLPPGVLFQSVSEWSIPVKRGGIDSVVGEYSISEPGPGPRATRHWKWARERGLKTMAKIQAGNTWELSAVPYIPALENVARHAANLREARVDGVMLGWTLGGYPSPNLEVACDIFTRPPSADPPEVVVDHALTAVAERRFGKEAAQAVVGAWRKCSEAFREFPYHIGVVYTAPLQLGPANLLWAEPTHYKATMVGFPYDDLDSWRAVYPTDVFASQLQKVAAGFRQGADALRAVSDKSPGEPLRKEADVMAASAIHFQSVANQSSFVELRRSLANSSTSAAKARVAEQIREIIAAEAKLAGELWAIQQRDSRIGFEASNQYYYVPEDLLEKILNCQHLLENWPME